MYCEGNFEHHCQVGSPEETIGDTPLADIKNEVAKQFVLKMRTAKQADKTIVNYFQVVRQWLRQPCRAKASNFILETGVSTSSDSRRRREKTVQAVSNHQGSRRNPRKGQGPLQVLFALLAGTGLRIGEALGLKLGEHLSGDFSTIKVRQSVWRGSVQTPKIDNAIREIDLPRSRAAFLKTYIGDRTSGFLFESESGRPLT
jgi:integrase